MPSIPILAVNPGMLKPTPANRAMPAPAFGCPPTVTDASGAALSLSFTRRMFGMIEPGLKSRRPAMVAP